MSSMPARLAWRAMVCAVLVVAIAGQSMREAQIHSLEEVSQFVPNMLVGDGSSPAW